MGEGRRARSGIEEVARGQLADGILCENAPLLRLKGGAHIHEKSVNPPGLLGPVKQRVDQTIGDARVVRAAQRDPQGVKLPVGLSVCGLERLR